MIYITLIIALLIYSVYDTFKYNVGAYSENCSKGHGKMSENITDLLDRIQWSNRYHSRVNVITRYLLYSVVISFACMIIIRENKHTDYCLIMFQTMLCVFTTLFAMHWFFRYHSDKFSTCFVDNNVDMIRKKLKLEEKNSERAGSLKTRDISDLDIHKILTDIV